MRGRGFLPIAAAMALIAAWPGVAVAQTADEYADEWTEARRGDRDWMQRGTEQLTTGITERVMGRPPTGPMLDAVNHIYTRVDQTWRASRDPCLAAALNQAQSQVVATGRQRVMSGAFDMLTSALGGAASGNDIRRFLGQRLFNQIKDHLQGKALDKFKEEMREAMKRGLPDYWSDSNNSASCNVEYRGVWNRAAERYEFIIAGDCNCNMMPCGPHLGGQVRLRRWAVEGWGTIEPVIEQGPGGEKTVRFSVSPPRDMWVTAECCGEGDQRRYRISRADAAGNEWVGLVPQPPATTPTPPRRPQTGGAPPPAEPPATGTTPRPPRPVREAPIDIPEIPDGPLTEAQQEELETRVFRAEERAQAAREAAYRRLNELQQSNAAADAIAEAEAAHEAAADTHRRARAARMRLSDKINQQANEQQQQQEQSSTPPDPASAQVLAIHNRERAAAGVPPLAWDPQLAANASAYARSLASGTPYGHAGRTGRETTERENLSMGYRGSSAVQMMGNWLKEKRNFRAGVFPDISATGNWRDAGHYSQMIWPTTSRVGCATAQGAQWAYLVCRYSPPGNRDGGRVP